MAASIEKSFGEKVEIVPGKSGQFDVLVDGSVIFSKADKGRFPVDGEVETDFAKLRNLPPPAISAAPSSGAKSFVSRVLSKMRN